MAEEKQGEESTESTSANPDWMRLLKERVNEVNVSDSDRKVLESSTIEDLELLRRAFLPFVNSGTGLGGPEGMLPIVTDFLTQQIPQNPDGTPAYKINVEKVAPAEPVAAPQNESTSS